MKNWRDECPLLAAFLDGAAHANSLPPHLHVEDVEASDAELCDAEEELMALLGEDAPATAEQLGMAEWLGERADAGYEVHAVDEDHPFDGDPVPLLCYTILERSY